MQTVLHDKFGIKTPEIGVFPSQASNAFATGWNRNAALVAVSEGLLHRFTEEECKAVMAHEIGHVANGDMITMTLIQGVVNTFVIFASRVIGSFVDRVVFKNENGHGIGDSQPCGTVYCFDWFSDCVVCGFVTTIGWAAYCGDFYHHRDFYDDVIEALKGDYSAK